jgi:hypothetical protein
MAQFEKTVDIWLTPEAEAENSPCLCPSCSILLFNIDEEHKQIKV